MNVTVTGWDSRPNSELILSSARPSPVPQQPLPHGPSGSFTFASDVGLGVEFESSAVREALKCSTSSPTETLLVLPFTALEPGIIKSDESGLASGAEVEGITLLRSALLRYEADGE
jgi:hypothetical protein